MALKWFELVDAAGEAITRMHYVSVDVPFAAGLRDAVQTKYATTFLAGIAPSELVVYANRAAFDAKRVPSEFDPIDSLGASPRDPLIVQAPPSNIPTVKRKWFQLVDAAGKALGVDYVSIDTTMVATLRGAVKTKNADSHLAGIAPTDLVVYANRAAMGARTPLKGSDTIDSFGESDEDPLIVQASPGIPPFILLDNIDSFEDECGSLTTWEVGVTHEVPLIHEFMKPLGGCTTNGKIFWRWEEQQLAALLLNGWFPETRSEKIHGFAGKSSIVLGSPGVGKSTLLCLLAFYVVLKHKKNVLVYRRLLTTGSKVLLYLGWRQDRVVYFSLPNCIPEELAKVRNSMGTSVALWLDGFVYDQIPQGLGTFTFLATSQQADLKSQDEEYAYRCLLPCWRQDDLFALGRAVFNYSHDDMVERFYYSGGSVRYFALPKIRDIKSAISHAVSRAIKTVSLEELLSISTFVSSGDTHVDRIRHTFLRETGGAVSADKLLYHDEWEQVVDSKYAVSLLSVRFTTADALYPIYEMARRSGYASLADGVFEMYLHRLAGEKMLRLFVSEYRTRGESNGPRYPEHFQPLYLQSGDVQCSGKKDDYVDALTTWRDSKEKTYWYPDDRDFPNIDSIVKRAAYGTASDQSSVPPTTAATLAETCDVAYLQITVAATHSIDGKQLEEMNKIFKAAVPTTTGSTAMAGKAAVPMRTTGSAPSQSVSQVEDDRPMYVAVCPDKASCDQLDLTKAPDVLDARRVCRVYVGYYQHAKFVINAGGRDVPCLERPKSPRRSERLLEKKPRVDDQSRG